ncbi:Glutaminase [Gloeomargarita lithophora Alchichica-D10]|uniref:Glutaminase n=1 Tax=Gloeomargarita lithophora Alchichica-D10 TaxID=1188229 RepID=A0A1J0AEX3_9CYAN|nr:glutaminase A [Gloeomargarita lithophora]APB34494.1 Glutaminase [Gloeomargarita lithophora Alchichica-D10]
MSLLLPDPVLVANLVRDSYQRFQGITDGKNADYIPALAQVPPDLFAIALVGVNGAVHLAGDTQVEFSMQSVSKPFVFALVCQAIGEQAAKEKLGVNNTGLPFNSVLAMERLHTGAHNPMVNAGAIAATSLVPGTTAEEKWQFLQTQISRFAGRSLTLNEVVYASEAAHNRHNQGLAKLLDAYDRIFFDPLQATDIYTKQCALNVTVRDLAVMGATLANGGVNPITGEMIIDPIHCQHVLAVMVTAGLYEQSGDWLYEVGLPGKSGVSGGMLTVSPGRGALATFAPPLDAAGNSIKGQKVAQHLSTTLGLNLFASRPWAQPV